MHARDTNEPDPESLGLAALAWALGDAVRADRLLALTGLDPATLRARAGDPATIAAALAFLAAHEPDLLACADALGTTPDTLVAAQAKLEQRA